MYYTITLSFTNPFTLSPTMSSQAATATPTETATATPSQASANNTLIEAIIVHWTSIESVNNSHSEVRRLNNEFMDANGIEYDEIIFINRIHKFSKFTFDEIDGITTQISIPIRRSIYDTVMQATVCYGMNQEIVHYTMRHWATPYFI